MNQDTERDNADLFDDVITKIKFDPLTRAEQYAQLRRIAAPAPSQGQAAPFGFISLRSVEWLRLRATWPRALIHTAIHTADVSEREEEEFVPIYTTAPQDVSKAHGALTEALEAMRHSANEWADMAINGLQHSRNLRDGIGTVESAAANMEDCLLHCRKVSDAAMAQMRAALAAATIRDAQDAASQGVQSEREACAVLCDQIAARKGERFFGSLVSDGSAAQCAKAIRARAAPAQQAPAEVPASAAQQATGEA